MYKEVSYFFQVYSFLHGYLVIKSKYLLGVFLVVVFLVLRLTFWGSWWAGATFRHSSHGDLSDGLAVQLGGDAHGVVRVVLQAVEPGAKVIHSKYYTGPPEHISTWLGPILSQFNDFLLLQCLLSRFDNRWRCDRFFEQKLLISACSLSMMI